MEPPPDSTKTYVGVMVPQRILSGFFEHVDIAGLSSSEYCTDYEQEIPIYIARSPRGSMNVVWPRLKHFE